MLAGDIDVPTARRLVAKGAITDAARLLADDFKTSGGAPRAAGDDLYKRPTIVTR